MTDSSDCESDAGASPSVSSDESATSSSRCSSPTALKIVTPLDVQQISTPKRKVSFFTSTPTGGGNARAATPGTSASTPAGNCSTPVSTGRKPTRRRQLCPPETPTASISSSNLRSNTSKTKASSSSSTAITIPRKRKRPSPRGIPSPQRSSNNSQHHDHGEGEDASLSSPDKKRKRNKRRRTRSERNLLAGKTTTTAAAPVVVAEGEEAVALDAEIDRVLEEKAIKNNLSATNVKTIIRHVITNNMVQKMIMSATRKKAEAGGDAGGSSDEDGLLKPKMTRAKTKELMGNKQISLWPIVDSPVKLSKQPVSETHMLIHNDLPEDSSGDEEYVPKATEIREIGHSDDESSVASSHTSDVGSPAVPIKYRVSTRRSMQAERSPFTDSVFKTPPPRPKVQRRNKSDSAISLRTRSKLPLNDTPLEDLERQLVPPDITKDMYDWDAETDEDYLAFLKDFLNPGHQNDANEVDDEADPEYNVMEDDEDLHDREELRMDRAVKVPKKELTDLIAELFEPGMLSGDEEDNDLATLTGITPLVNDLAFTDSVVRCGDESMNSTALETPISTVDTTVLGLTTTDGGPSTVPPTVNTAVSVEQSRKDFLEGAPQPVIFLEVNNNQVNFAPPPLELSEQSHGSVTVVKNTGAQEVIHAPPYFRECDLNFLKHQMRQHVQLLTQSYVLTVSSENSCLRNIAKSTKTMVNEIKNFSKLNGPTSNFSVCNVESAWTLVNFWPHKFFNKSPIKKKILEIKYISENGFTTNEEGKPMSSKYFPWHVVKAIAENNAFIYNSLLPESYHQMNTHSRVYFSYFEDMLLIEALEYLKGLDLKTMKMAEVISDVLLTIHTPTQVYHRIRNLRKSNSGCHPDIKKYFTEGVLPEPDRTVPELKAEDVLPLIQRDRRGLSKQWTALLLHFEDSSRLRWEEKLKSDPVTRSIGTKIGKIIHKQKEKGKDKPVTFTRSTTINRVFTQGALEVDKQDPSVWSMNLLKPNGEVGVFISIPRLGLVDPAMQQEPIEGKEAERTVTRMKLVEPQQPREAQEAGKASDLSSSHQQGASKGYSEGLQNAEQPLSKTPSKCTQVLVNSPEDDFVFKTPRRPESASAVVSSPSYSVVQVVGKPFDLPELGNTSNEVINLSSLQTPMKKIIMEKMAEQAKIEQNSSNLKEESSSLKVVVKDDEDEYESESGYSAYSNVVMEGTEVELTSDEGTMDEDSIECHEMITLSSDEDEKIVIPKLAAASGNGNDYNGGGGSNSPPKKVDSNCGAGNTSRQGNSPNPSSSTTTPANNPSTSKKCGTLRTCGDGRGDDSDEDGERRLNNFNKKRALPKDYTGDDDYEEKDKPKRNQHNVMQAPPPPPAAVPCSHPSPPSQPPPLQQIPISNSSLSSSTGISSKHSKKAKRSPGCQGGNKSKVSSKYNVTSPEKMFEEAANEYEDVEDAYMESYLARVQSTTEANHPGTYASFTQVLHDFGENPSGKRKELHAKVKVIFKDYPDLLQEFESIMNGTIASSYDVTSSHGDTMAEINFIQMVEKYTVNCPALKAKIMNKWKSLKEKPNLTEKDLATAMEPFFNGNPVMMEAFKALLPSVYRPQSVSSDMDFEVVDLDMEDPPQHKGGGGDAAINEDLHYEIVKLPDETQVPATSTCPCVCHTKTKDSAFASRSKHCQKCSLKFQDGKIYIHNGRVMRPVSVELTPLSSNKTPASVSSNSARSTQAPPPSHHHEPRTIKKDPHHHHLHPPLYPPSSLQPQSVTKTKEVKKDPSVELCVVKPSASSSSDKRTHVPSLPLTQLAFSSSTKPSSSTTPTGEETEKQEETAIESGATPTISPRLAQQPLPSNPPQQDNDDDDDLEWTEEEDRIILTVLKQEDLPLPLMWRKIASQIPHRTLDQLENRFAEMMEIFEAESMKDDE